MSPKIRASMADVETSFVPVPPGIYELEILGVKENEVSKSPERWAYEFEYQVVRADESENAGEVGRKFKNTYYIHKKDGSVNEYAVAEVKRHFEVTLGEEVANDPEADTDQLKNQRLRAQVALESYQKENKLTQTTETRKKSVIEAIAPLN